MSNDQPIWYNFNLIVVKICNSITEKDVQIIKDRLN